MLPGGTSLSLLILTQCGAGGWGERSKKPEAQPSNNGISQQFLLLRNLVTLGLVVMKERGACYCLQ